jgi:AraC family transcriptional regulator
MLHRHCLFSGPLVTVSDIHCRAEAPPMPEEEALSHQVVFVRSGMFVKHVGSRRIVAEPAHVLFFNKGETYRVSHPSRGDDCTIVSCSPELAGELTSVGVDDAHEIAAPFSSSHAPISATAAIRHHLLRRALRDKPFSALEAEEWTIDLLRSVMYNPNPSLIERSARQSTAIHRRNVVDETKVILAGNPSRSFSLAELARSVASSPFHLTRIFRADVGMPVHQYLLRLRLTLSLERLASGSRNLSELALDLGFASHSHFTTAFRQRFGMSPSIFRHKASTSSVRSLSRALAS